LQLYWKSENTAEVDFVLQFETEIIPVEVKKGKRNRSRSLDIFKKKYNCPYVIRISQKNFGFENNIKSVLRRFRQFTFNRVTIIQKTVARFFCARFLIAFARFIIIRPLNCL
jgi:hypothetical protein